MIRKKAQPLIWSLLPLLVAMSSCAYSTSNWRGDGRVVHPANSDRRIYQIAFDPPLSTTTTAAQTYRIEGAPPYSMELRIRLGGIHDRETANSVAGMLKARAKISDATGRTIFERDGSVQDGTLIIAEDAQSWYVRFAGAGFHANTHEKYILQISIAGLRDALPPELTIYPELWGGRYFVL